MSVMSAIQELLATPDWPLKIAGYVISLGIIGALWELIKWLRESRQHKSEMEASAYNEAYSRLEQQYIDYNKLLLRYPELGVYVLQDDPPNLSADDQARRKIIYEILFAILERAYLDRERTEEITNHQWPGWDSFLRLYMKKPSCLAAWREWSGGYGADGRFEEYVNKDVLGPGSAKNLTH